MSRVPDDLRIAGRRLGRGPGFTALAVGSLALAIGANSAVFGLVDGVLFARLPFPEPDRLVRAWEERPARGWWRFGVSHPAFQDWRDGLRSLEALAAYTRRSANLAGPERPQRVEVVEVTADAFAVFGVQPRLGRAFLRDEETAGRDAVALLAFEFWRDAFASDPAILGRTVALDGVPHVVAGVLPPEAGRAFEGAQVWRPLAVGVDIRRGARWLEVVGRLRAGVDIRTAGAELDTLAARHAVEYPETNTGWTATLVPLREARAEGSRPLLVALAAAVALVLLVACANVAGLMIVRGEEREPELAIRAALGASPGRLARLVAVESLVVALLGGAAGLLLAALSRKGLAAVVGDAVSGTASGALDLRVVSFTTLATLATALVFGVVPAMHATRALPPSRLRARRVLVGVELAIALALFSAAGFLVRSVGRLLDVDAGFDPRGALALRVAPPQSRPQPGQSEEEFVGQFRAERDRMAAFYDRLLARLEALPGVQAAGAINRLPLTGRWWTIGVAAEGEAPATAGDKPSASGRVVTPGYFRAMGIPVRSGRVFDARDGASAPPVAVVSESLARRTWPGRSPVGQRLSIDGRPPAEVVGVVADVRFEGLDAQAPPAVYVPFAQAMFGLFPDWGLDVVVRTSRPSAAGAAVRSAVEALDRSLPVFALRPLDEVVAASMARRRAAMTLLGVFAALAGLLSAVGLYGVVAQSARQRRKELAVRVALGAQRRDIGRLIVREGLALALAGGAAGLVAAVAAGRLLSTLLFGVGPLDAPALLGSAALLGVIALAASLVPAVRAGRADPLPALRGER